VKLFDHLATKVQEERMVRPQKLFAKS